MCSGQTEKNCSIQSPHLCAPVRIAIVPSSLVPGILFGFVSGNKILNYMGKTPKQCEGTGVDRQQDEDDFEDDDEDGGFRSAMRRLGPSLANTHARLLLVNAVIRLYFSQRC